MTIEDFKLNFKIMPAGENECWTYSMVWVEDGCTNKPASYVEIKLWEVLNSLIEKYNEKEKKLKYIKDNFRSDTSDFRWLEDIFNES